MLKHNLLISVNIGRLHDRASPTSPLESLKVQDKPGENRVP
jgi:hypothetical protein